MAGSNETDVSEILEEIITKSTNKKSPINNNIQEQDIVASTSRYIVITESDPKILNKNYIERKESEEHVLREISAFDKSENNVKINMEEYIKASLNEIVVYALKTELSKKEEGSPGPSFISSDIDNKSKEIIATIGKISDRESLVSIMCRICYDDTLDEPIISPCKCKGTVGMVHKSCIERWLAESNTNQCDLCQYRFHTERTTKFSVKQSIFRWLRYPPSNFAFSIRDMRSDMITCGVLIPFSVGLIYLCLVAADYYNRHKFTIIPIARWTAISVLVMGLVIILGFTIWIYLVVRYHCRVWYFWWQRETVVVLLDYKHAKES